MKKVSHILLLLLTIVSCNKVELIETANNVNSISPTSNEQILMEKKWTSKSSAYNIVQGKDNLFFIRGFEEGKRYIAGIDASLNTIWKHTLDVENERIISFQYADKAYILLVAMKYTLSGETLTESQMILRVYDEQGSVVAKKNVNFAELGMGVLVLRGDIKLAGLPDNGRFYFLGKAASAGKENRLIAFSFDAVNRQFPNAVTLWKVQNNSSQGLIDIVFKNNPETTVGSHNTQLVALKWGKVGFANISIPNLFSTSGVQTAQHGINGVTISSDYSTDITDNSTYHDMAARYGQSGKLEQVYFLFQHKRLDNVDKRWTTSSVLAYDARVPFAKQWSYISTITANDDRFYRLLLDREKLYMVGQAGGYARTFDNTTKIFGYGAVVLFNAVTGAKQSIQTFGNKYYGSSFNGAVVLGNEMFLVGYTNQYTSSSAENVPNWMVDIPKGNFIQWMVKIRK